MMDFGESIEKYDVAWKKPLGKGGFATVYKAKCKNTNIYVAIKMIDKEKMHKSGMANRVRQEVTIHSQLKHPSILELYTFFEDINFVYLVLEYAERGELHRYLRDHKRIMNEIEAATILKQVVEGLFYLHSHRIVHRDISLSNLLLTEDMKVKIGDFGLATLDQPGEKHMTLCGTPNYISPEVASRASHGLAVDVWGLGCLLYTLLVGKPPFDSDAVKSTLARVVKADFTIPSFVSYEARDLIERFLRKNPTERIKLEEVLSHPFIQKIQKCAYSKYNNTLASSDSGMLTMSSNSSQNQSRQTFNKSTVPRSRSEDRFNPLPAMHEIPQFSHGPCSSYSSYNEPPHTSDMMLSSLHNHGVLQKFNSLEVDQEKENNKLVTAGIPKTNSMSSGSSSDKYEETNPFSTRQPLLDSQKANTRQRTHSYNSPGLSTPLHASTPQGPSHSTEEMPKNPTPPLNTERLNPTRHKTKNVILSILESGEVVIEFIKYKTRYKEDRVVEVIRISKDGQKIVYYMPNNGQGTSVMDDPPVIPRNGPDSIYNYDNLPSKYWKKYSYGARFVSMVRAKTLKITYHSPQCKFQMMESLEDFDSFFYNGIRVVKSAVDGVKLFDGNGHVLYNSVEEICSSRYQDCWEHFNECMDHCLSMEAVLSRMQTSGMCFPIIVGKRPVSVSAQAIHSINSKNFTTPKPSILTPVSSLETYNTPLTSLPTTTRTSSLQIPAAYSQKNIIIRTVNIPGIGTASQYAQGVVQVDYEDGSKLSVIPPEQGDGVTYSKYGCMPKHFSKNDQLPDEIRTKLLNFQSVIVKYLMESPIIPENGRSTIPMQRSSSMRYLR